MEGRSSMLVLNSNHRVFVIMVRWACTSKVLRLLVGISARRVGLTTPDRVYVKGTF